jgi:hypothetical protein
LIWNNFGLLLALDFAKAHLTSMSRASDEIRSGSVRSHDREGVQQFQDEVAIVMVHRNAASLWMRNKLPNPPKYCAIHMKSLDSGPGRQLQK